MTRDRWRGLAAFACMLVMNCNTSDSTIESRFDTLNRTVQIGNWKYDLRVENQNLKDTAAQQQLKEHYLKATLYVSNTKTNQSLLYSASKDRDEYEAKYKYLSFNSKDDLYIKCNDELIYPIGYVFEPSNGLSNSERLVYKFQLSEAEYNMLKKNNDNVEYWYVDHLIDLGKICFKQQ